MADAALAAVSRGAWAGLSELMLPEGTLWNTRDKAGAPAWSVLTRAQVRETQSKEVFTERGFAGEARVSGHLASVWLPYDFYRDGKWSHCGIDSLTLVETPEGWRIAQFSYTVEQPPACAKHPAGPPLGAK